MTAKTPDSIIDNAVELYLSGIAPKDIARQLGIGYHGTLYGLRRRGIKVISKSERVAIRFDDADVADLFISGMGVGGISKRLNIGPTVVAKSLARSGINTRNRSEQQQARMDACTPEQRKAITKAANKAATGRVATVSENRKRAATVEKQGKCRSHLEEFALDAISEHFPNAIAGKAIDIYNADIAIGSVTVEIFGGGWSISDQRRISRYVSRCKKIGGFGFHTIFVIAMRGTDDIDTSKLIELINVASRLPPAPSQYWVIWGNGYESSGLSCDIDNRAFVCPTKHGRDSTTGRYISVT